MKLLEIKVAFNINQRNSNEQLLLLENFRCKAAFVVRQLFQFYSIDRLL